MKENEITLMQQVWDKYKEIHDILTKLFLECRDNNPEDTYLILKEIDALRTDLFEKERYTINTIAEEHYKFSFRFKKKMNKNVDPKKTTKKT